MPNYHVNNDSVVGACSAQYKCRFGDTPHYDTFNEAQKAAEQQLGEKIKILSSTSSKPIPDNKIVLGMRPMKEMDTTLLTMTMFNNIRQWASATDIQNIERALIISSSLHVNDFRKSPRDTLNKPPYMEHVLRVTLRLVKYYNIKDSNVVISALLHDTVEDHAVDFYPEIKDESEARKHVLNYYNDSFGSNVAKTVKDLTNPIMETTNPKEKREIYYNHVKESIESNENALLVKVSDYIDNAGSLHITHKKVAHKEGTQNMIKKYLPMSELFVHNIDKSSLGSSQKDKIKERLHRVDTHLNAMLS